VIAIYRLIIELGLPDGKNQIVKVAIRVIAMTLWLMFVCSIKKKKWKYALMKLIPFIAVAYLIFFTEQQKNSMKEGQIFTSTVIIMILFSLFSAIQITMDYRIKIFILLTFTIYMFFRIIGFSNY